MRHTILNKNNSKNINLLIFYFIIIEFGFVSSTDLGGGDFEVNNPKVKSSQTAIIYEIKVLPVLYIREH